jgi:hypothetical protein
LPNKHCWVDGRNPEDRKNWTILATVQQVPKVALLYLFLRGKILLSFRKGALDRVRKGLVPLSAGGRPYKGFLEQPLLLLKFLLEVW